MEVIYAKTIVQGKDQCGKHGTFLANDKNERISPLFDSLADLYPWMREHGWVIDESDGDKFIPWRVSNTSK